MADSIAQSRATDAGNKDNSKRYFQFLLLLLAAGAIYPLLYLRQNFETSILEVYQITTIDLADYYSMLGVMYFVGYLPSGWQTDRVSPRLLVTFSMAVVAWSKRY